MTSPEPCLACGAELPSDGSRAPCPHCGHERPLGATSTTGYEAAPAALDPAQLAPHLPQLEILGLLGRGGMGAVYRARQTRLDRLVALKVLPPEADRDPSFAARFGREARTLARLSHPYIVGVHDFGEADGLYYLLMEYVEGGSLRERLRGGRLDVGEALAIGRQICDALEYAHEEGVAHRDIKPENILLDKKGRVKVADFGLAKLLGPVPAEPQLTGSHQILGTLKYMAPEQLERPLEVDHRADLYALGVVLYEMLTGELPFGRFVLPSEKGVGDSRLDEVILRALERDPARRFQSASEMGTALGCLSERRTAAAPTQVLTATSAAGAKKVALRRLRGAGDALETTGALAFMFGIAWSLGWGVIHTALKPEFFPRGVLLGLLGLLPLAQGVRIIRGVRQMQRLEGYGAATRAGFLALLPLSPAVVVGFPVGIWVLLVLNDPAVAATFRAGRPQHQAGAALAGARTEAHSTSGWKWLFGRLPVLGFLLCLRVLGRLPLWGFFLCLIGAAACFEPFFPWAELQVIDDTGQAVPLAAVYSFEAGWVPTTGTAFLIPCCMLLLTGFTGPPHRWLPPLCILVGLFAVLVTSPAILSSSLEVGMESREQRLDEQGRPEGRKDEPPQYRGTASVVVLGKKILVAYEGLDAGRGGFTCSFAAQERFGKKGKQVTLHYQYKKDKQVVWDPPEKIPRFLLREKGRTSISAWGYLVIMLGLALIYIGCRQLHTTLRRRHPAP